MQIVPMRDLKDTVKIEKMCEESREPVFVTKNGYGKLVVMNIEYFEQLVKDAYEVSMVTKGLEALKEGKYREGNIVMEEMKKKYGL